MTNVPGKCLAIFFLALSCSVCVRQAAWPAVFAVGSEEPNAPAAGRRSAEIWFGPQAPYPSKEAPTGTAGPIDWNKLFEPRASWPRVSKRTDVVTFNTQYLSRASDADLSRVLSSLERMRIKFGIEMLAQAYTPGCGYGVEGYSSSAEVQLIAEKLARVHAIPKYIAMDEPLWFGHFYHGRNACNSTIEEVARRVAVNLHIYQKAFPSVLIGDIEPVPSLTSQGSWEEDYRLWQTQFKKVAGQALSFLQLDVSWDENNHWDSGNWQAGLTKVAALTRASGIRLGIIYNGTSADSEDVTWFNHATSNILATESTLGIVPDIAYFSSWDLHPSHALPEDAGYSHTQLVSQYLVPRTILSAERAGENIEGRITDVSGHAVSGVPITISSLGNTLPGRLRNLTFFGVVPKDSTLAIVALRVNTECNCSGAANLRIGKFRYKENAGGEVTWDHDFITAVGKESSIASVNSEPESGDKIVKVTVESNQTLLLNSPNFPVSPGAHYTFNLKMDTAPGVYVPGYVAIMFTDSTGRVSRRIHVTSNTDDFVPYLLVRTDRDGKFRLPAVFEANHSFLPMRITFQGESHWRSSEIVVN